jgi:hypothetical protein
MLFTVLGALLVTVRIFGPDAETTQRLAPR